MITIIAGTNEEYEKMMEVALEYMCHQLPFIVCRIYEPGGCKICYKENHAKCGINIFRAIDDSSADEL